MINKKCTIPSKNGVFCAKLKTEILLSAIEIGVEGQRKHIQIMTLFRPIRSLKCSW